MGASQLRSPVGMRRRSEDGTLGTNGAGGVGPADKPVPEQILQPKPSSEDSNISILSNGEEAVIELDEAQTFAPDSRFFLVADQTKTFTWHLNDSVEVTQVQWQKDDFASGAAGNRHVIADAQLSNAAAGASEFKNNRDFFQVSRNRANEQMNAQLRVSDFTKYQNLTDLLGDRFTILINWETEMATGWTLSGIFTVVESFEDGVQWGLENFLDSDSEELTQEKQNGKVRTVFKDTEMDLAPTSILAGSSATSSAPAIQAPSDPPPPVAAASTNSGLSTGVIAGIAVGAAAFFILLITAIFLLYRRRHRKRQADEQAGYDSQQGATVYFADKETSRLPETPPTPYSEDGGHRLPLNESSGVVEQDQRHSSTRDMSDSNNTTFVPYKNPEPATSRTDLAMRNGTITPLGVSATIAHLVEDGMTEADLRRLEEEERQLDDAIAQARRR
ncbi:Proline-rich receptor-like protein kinase PERK1 [Paramyrothecium foliicola]|nr:Proline-rich receptor-like protein kinase PERK1 [Paramyrothecium foliicola]